MTSSPSKPLRLFLLALRLALGAIFIYAAWIKLREPWMLFAMSVDAYHVLPQWAVIAVARGLPWFELLLGVVLITGMFRRTSSLAASALLAVFFGLMVRAYLRGETIDCGCFGPGEQISWVTLLRDGSMLASALFLLVMSLQRGSGRLSRRGDLRDSLGAANLREAGHRSA